MNRVQTRPFQPSSDHEKGVLSKRYQAILAALARHLPPSGLAAQRVLDVGDYYPTLPIYLAKHGASVSVLDLDCPAETLNLYSKWNIDFHKCDLNTVRDCPPPIGDQVDIIVWLEVIEHLTCSPKYVFREFARLLKPGGLLIVGTPNAGRLSSRMRGVMGRHPYILSLESQYFWAEEFVGHRREYYPYEIDLMLDWNRYEIQERIYFNGCIADHKKHGWLRSAPYLALTYCLKQLRWLYIVIAKSSGEKPYELPVVPLKRV